LAIDCLLLSFLEHHMLAKFLRILLEFDLSSDELLVLCSPIYFACFLVLELYEIILSCHSFGIILYFPLFSNPSLT
jgi:hypothetical protein